MSLYQTGIQPHVTLVNYDHPQKLEDEYGGWVSRKMVYDSKSFKLFFKAKLVFNILILI